MADLQNTHDALVSALLKILDQTIRGSHSPMVYQLDDALQSILDASPNVHLVPGYTVTKEELPKFVNLLRTKLHETAKTNS
jgi:hypothetical protein